VPDEPRGSRPDLWGGGCDSRRLPGTESTRPSSWPRASPPSCSGPATTGAHTDVEWVGLTYTVDCARILTETALTCFMLRPGRPTRR
jgi:hypothetical protein